MGFRAEKRHNLSMDILFRKSQAQTTSRNVLRSITWVSSSSIFSIPLLPFSASSESPSLSGSFSSSGSAAFSTMFSSSLEIQKDLIFGCTSDQQGGFNFSEPWYEQLT